MQSKSFFDSEPSHEATAIELRVWSEKLKSRITKLEEEKKSCRANFYSIRRELASLNRACAGYKKYIEELETNSPVTF